MTLPVIGFAGMTHLGLVSGVSAAEKGFNTVCFDPDRARIADLNIGKLPVSEPQLDDLLSKNRQRITFSAEIESLRDCEVVYVAPDVATNDTGQSDLTTINTLLEGVLAATRPKTVIIVLSQVPPGFTRSKQRDGRILYYQVETLIFGRAVERALYPERFILGCADPAHPLPRSVRSFLEAHGCPILPMRYESAELAKISINMCLVASVSTANTLAELCEKIGADWSEIVPALKLDKRIGHHSYLAPGLGIAGGNLERDLTTVCTFADQLGTDAGVVRAWIANSAHRRDWPLRVLQSEVFSRLDDPIIAVWGLAYKQNTDSIKNSPAIALIGNIGDRKVQVFDPVVSKTATLNKSCVRAKSELEACAAADVLVVLTPWKQFSAVAPRDIASNLRGKIVIDPYRVLDYVACRDAGLRYLTLGVAG